MLDERLDNLKKLGIVDLVPRFALKGAKPVQMEPSKDGHLLSKASCAPSALPEASGSQKQGKGSLSSLSSIENRLSKPLIEVLEPSSVATLNAKKRKKLAVNSDNTLQGASENRQFRLRFYQLDSILFIFSQPSVSWHNETKEQRFLADLTVFLTKKSNYETSLNEIFLWPPQKTLSNHLHYDALLQFTDFHTKNNQTTQIVTLGLALSDYFECEKDKRKINGISQPVIVLNSILYYLNNPEQKKHLLSHLISGLDG